MGEQSEVSPERIHKMVWAFAPPLILEAAIRNRVFDVLDSGPKNLAEVTRETGASERGLRAIMDALVGLQFLQRTDERYALTPESAAFLVSTKPGFQGGLMKHASTQLIPAWLHLTEIVRTGRPERAVNQEGTGGEFFRELVVDLFPMNFAAARALGDALRVADTPGTVRVLDIAAGSGVWGIGLAQDHPNVEVTALDWPAVLPVTRQFAERFGLAQRFRYLEGDLMTVDYGEGYQVVTLGHILHSEGEARSRELLRKVYEALAPGGTVAIAEFLTDEERSTEVGGLVFAVNMLVATTEGTTFSFGQIRRWLEEIGFGEVRSLPAPAPSPLILATK